MFFLKALTSLLMWLSDTKGSESRTLWEPHNNITFIQRRIASVYKWLLFYYSILEVTTESCPVWIDLAMSIFIETWSRLLERSLFVRHSRFNQETLTSYPWIWKKKRTYILLQDADAYVWFVWISFDMCFYDEAILIHFFSLRRLRLVKQNQFYLVSNFFLLHAKKLQWTTAINHIFISYFNVVDTWIKKSTASVFILILKVK